MARIKRYTKRISFHITQEMYTWYEGRSVAESRPASELIREALTKWQEYQTRLGEDEEEG